MNKSEIAEKAARRIVGEIFTEHNPEQSLVWQKRFAVIVERAIAESQAPQPSPRVCIHCGEDSWAHCRFHQPAHCKVECAQAHHDPILATEKYELGDGEPSPDNYDRDKVRQLEREIESEPGNKFVGWKLGESGAAQEVSPSPLDLMKQANQLLRRLNKEVFNNAVDPMNLPHAVDLVCSFAEQYAAEGGTRELKAALAKIADEIEHTVFFREIDCLETDPSALKRQIANLVRSKVFRG